MNKRTMLISLLISLIFAAIVGTAVFAVCADPGTSDDPLVSKSYVDAQIASVKSTSAASYSVVHVSAGQKVIGKEGTEIIVRSGSVSAIDNGVNGISDLTTGYELMTGYTAGVNHLLLIPRDDGRGIKALTEAYLMIRGGYTIK